MKKITCIINKKQIKKITAFSTFFFFLAISIMYISPNKTKLRSDYRSSELLKKETQEDNYVRTDYYNKDGKLTIAGDLGYATCIITKAENGILEKYYDENGNPINSYLSYYAIYREYDEEGKVVRISYLDDKDNPTIMYYGYAIEKRAYNSCKQVMTVKYYDAFDNPIKTPAYAYGKKNEYDENGRINCITYIDSNGNPMITGQGYAIIQRCFYNADSPWNGKVESEHYYDQDGKPVCLSLGQYGIHKEYDENGLESVLTYLDAEGKPTVTNKGYTTVVRTFQTNNTIATEQYYDIDGKPFALSEGQHGVKNNNGITIYLDENGKDTTNIRNILYNHSRIVIIISIGIIIIASLLSKEWNYLLFVLCLITIIYLTLMYRYRVQTQSIVWFDTIIHLFADDEARSEFLRNMWLFSPLGATLYRINSKTKTLLIPIAFSLFIETLQFINKTGYCQMDDVISNSIGGVVGFFAEKMTLTIIQRIKPRRQIHTI